MPGASFTTFHTNAPSGAVLFQELANADVVGGVYMGSKNDPVGQTVTYTCEAKAAITFDVEVEGTSVKVPTAFADYVQTFLDGHPDLRVVSMQ